jgi:hypothetical protein
MSLGTAQLIHNVQIHKHNSLTNVHLALGWEETSGEKWYILSTEPTTLQTFREYRLVDPHWFRGSSYLKIGWSWVKRAIINGWNLLSSASFTTNIDPDPVKASHSQYLQKKYRIEFRAYTHVWA